MGAKVVPSLENARSFSVVVLPNVSVLPLTEQGTVGPIVLQKETFLYDPAGRLFGRLEKIPGVILTPSIERAGLWKVQKRDRGFNVP